jgi:hypothetical protein
MLDKTTYTTMPTTAPLRVVSGQTISKTRKAWGARNRAQFAAEWLIGLIEVKPTLKMAAAVFSVSIPYVNAALEDLKAEAEYIGNGHLTNGNGFAAPVSDIDAAWLNMDENERKAFVLRHLGTVWDAVEAAT